MFLRAAIITINSTPLLLMADEEQEQQEFTSSNGTKEINSWKEDVEAILASLALATKI
jgi:hypothetical protein